ncbi:hypothetical protein DPSP01_014754 [Paraphaeosphaeria sporulosa]
MLPTTNKRLNISMLTPYTKPLCPPSNAARRGFMFHSLRISLALKTTTFLFLVITGPSAPLLSAQPPSQLFRSILAPLHSPHHTPPLPSPPTPKVKKRQGW